MHMTIVHFIHLRPTLLFIVMLFFWLKDPPAAVNKGSIRMFNVIFVSRMKAFSNYSKAS